jgi:dihydrodipicolinate synthase/N-acetylneuraminate lyase
VEQEVSEVERCTDDDVAVIELSGDEAPSVPPLEQAGAAALGDTFELSRETADVGVRHAAIIGRSYTRASSGA